MQKIPIAIIGIGCRFPGINHHRELWDLLVRGEEAHGKADFCAIAADGNQASTKQLNGVDRFDAEFFNIAPQTAELMDPSQRLLLEVAWETLEDAGQVPQDLAGSNTGVFIGITNTYYYELLGTEARQQFEATTGNQRGLAANRLSYFFDFQGVSLAIDTACSSSLLAVDRACRSLWTEESDLALAGGVNLVLTTGDTVRLEQAGLITAEGRCKVFDAAADGYVRSDGIGLVLLKLLPQAQADGDRIYAVIQNSTVNHNGRSNGLTAPNLQAQVNLLTKAYQQAEIDPKSVHYVEAHATGTPIGDALELKAIGRVLGEGRSPENFCHVGSIKTNLGHTETASGIAGLIKIALIAYHRQLPPHLHLQQINPSVTLEKLGLQIPQALEPIPNPDLLFTMGVSAFGLGGTNVHTILQSSPSECLLPSTAKLPIQIFVLSAKTQTALQNLVRQYQAICQHQPDLDLETLCCNANTARTQFSHRFCTVVTSLAELEQQLQNYLDGKNGDRLFVSKITKRQRQKSILAAAQDITNIPSIDQLSQNNHLDSTLLTEIFLNFCVLWSEGYNFDWKTLYPPQKYPRLFLPTYPFERQSFWISQPQTLSIQEIQTTTSNIVQDISIASTEKNNPSFNAHFVPPETNLEKQLIAIWQTILNVPEIGVKDNFFDLGGDSQLSIQLARAIETKIQRKLPLSTLFELTTIAQQAYLIEQEALTSIDSMIESHVSEADSLTPEEYRDCLAIVAGRPGKRHRKDAFIVGLNTVGSKQPFFFCANSYGEAQPLAIALGEEHSFYLLESGYFTFRRSTKNQIKRLAAKQLEEIRQIQPEPPYAIGGYSFGSLVAYEVAQQLMRLNQEVKLLAIFDHPGHEAMSQSWLYPGKIFDRLQKNQKLYPKKEETYQFETYGGRLTLFFARQSFRNISSGYLKLIPLWLTPRAGWPSNIAPNLEVHIVPGDHFSMMREPNIQSLANQLKACLEQ